MDDLVFALFSSRDEDGARELDGIVTRLSRALPCPPRRIELMHRGPLDIRPSSRVFALLIQEGESYRRLKETGCVVSRPLLGSREDAQEAAKCLNLTLPRQDGTVYILLAHGSHNHSVRYHDVLSECLREDIILTDLDSCCSSIPDCPHPVLVPFLLSFGHHAKEATSRLEKMNSALTVFRQGILSTCPALEAVFRRRLQEIM